MIFNSLLRSSRFLRYRCQFPTLRQFSTSDAFKNTTAAVKIDDVQRKGLESFRSSQFTNLQGLESLTEENLFHLIADFLVKPETPDLAMSEKLINKFVFTHPGIDPQGELCSLFLIQLLQKRTRENTSKAVDFFKSLLEAVAIEKAAAPVQIKISQFLIEYILEAIFEIKDDISGGELYQICNDTRFKHLVPTFNAYKDRLILELFLPSLNWKFVDLIVSDSVNSNNQITVSSNVLAEIFHVLLHPNNDDLYFEPINQEPFANTTIQPRFHRLVELLERWISSGISIKGLEMSKAVAKTFSRFIPSESMMKKLETLF